MGAMTGPEIARAPMSNRVLRRVAALAVMAIAAIPARTSAQSLSSTELARLSKRAADITITRDDWGIAHVHGRTDADAVFGMIYAQAEDDFNRIEVNYLNSLGRMAEAEGESAVWTDLRQRLFIDPDSLKSLYATSPAWLRSLMNGWADGLNYFLAKHPDVHPRVLTHFEPWMALSFSEGSIGGDIERVNTRALQAFYETGSPSVAPRGTQPTREELLGSAELSEPPVESGPPREPTGSNGMAIAPSNTVNHRSLLLINPHTSFFFRSELQMTSDEGLNAYGAATWGQLFLYQGFNDNVGWMHTSSGVDNIDEFLETVMQTGDGQFGYRHGSELRIMKPHRIVLRVRQADGTLKDRVFTTYRTMHGPVIRKQGDKWVSIALMENPAKALEQSYIRTKAKSIPDFVKSMELHTNSSNNTILADRLGNIAYYHSNYIPRRDTRFDWTKPVDGSDPATDYRGVLSIDETPHLFNPASGWLYNSNNWPWSAAGPSSPKREDFPAYVESGGESARGLHALRVLSNRHDFTLAGLIDAAYDSYQPWFEKPIPALLAAYDAAPDSDPLKAKLKEQIDVLRNWDYRWSATSIPTTLAIYWGENVMRADFSNPANGPQLLKALDAAATKLTNDFGTWKTPWGEVNRFQRLTDDIVHPFTDAGPSIPVMFTSATWGSLASFGARQYPGTKRRYGTSGNSFVAVVEFGDTIHARAVTAGGESGNPKSPHFNDEAERYATGNLREVYFYPRQLKGHTERVYHP